MRSTILAMVFGAALAASGIEPPRITAIAPETPTVNPKPQLITVTGDGFVPGLTLTIRTPGGDVRTLSGQDIVSPRATSFRANVLFDAAGPYEFVVMNTDGTKSDPFRVQAKAAQKQPRIDQIDPAELSKSQEPQVVTIRGNNFEPGIKISVTDPTGTVTLRDTIDKVEPGLVVARLVFEQSGPHAIMVTNTSGTSSNSVTLTVR